MKIPEEKRIRSYELTCLVSAEYTQEELGKIKDGIGKVIAKGGGKISESIEWGKREMAYTIKKAGKRYDQANYLHFVFEAEADQATVIKDAINITENVIRYLLVVQDQ